MCYSVVFISLDKSVLIAQNELPPPSEVIEGDIRFIFYRLSFYICDCSMLITIRTLIHENYIKYLRKEEAGQFIYF